MNTPDCAILGMGYLGRALAEKLFEEGSRVSAVKKTLTSDDINLPVDVHIADLNDEAVFQTASWQAWADKPVWICLLPPSSPPTVPEGEERLRMQPGCIGRWH